MLKRSPSLHVCIVGIEALGLAVGVVLFIARKVGLAHAIWLACVVPSCVVLCVSAANAFRRREAGIDVLALLSMIVAAAIGESFTAAVVSLMVAGGRALEAFAQARAGAEMTALLKLAPNHANRYEAGEWRQVDPDAIRAGDRLLVRAGERVPADGALTHQAELDESALTGEAAIRSRNAGESVQSGVLNAGPPFEMIAAATVRDSTFAGIIRMVEAAQKTRGPTARLADRYAIFFVPVTLLIAGICWIVTGDVIRALAVLVVATPCPLLLAVPVAIVSGMSTCAKHGVLVKSGEAIERLASAQILFFDKTGTLTSGRARLVAIESSPGIKPERVLQLAASLAQASSHVVAEALTLAARERALALSVPSQVTECPGAGLIGTVEGNVVAIGSFTHAAAQAQAAPWSAAFLRRLGHEDGSAVFVDVDGVMVGAFRLADPIRLDTPRAVRLLRRAGVSRIAMLTGDRRDVAESIGARLGVSEIHSEQTPADKLSLIRSAREHGVVVMVGDGINDAPALAAADIGVAMGVRGAAASAQAADIVLLTDRVDRLVVGLEIARRCRRIAIQSATAGMGLSIVAMIVAALGYVSPPYGALLQEVIDMAVIGNALRVLRLRTGSHQPMLPRGDASRLRAAHTTLEPVLGELRRLAEALPELPRQSVTSELVRINELLVRVLLPHEQEDDIRLYPELASKLAGEDPLAAMSGTHAEIFRTVHVLQRIAADLPADGPDEQGMRELQRLLYVLDAVVRMHCAQEDELFHTLDEGA
ncbi:heavy metal translocating P-type ATPase [Caballeronia sp. AZ1_KS37]|uniref:heavy metal translocating P-type ATPase n=1 Tax=Caballeronia sp. AZ1_KS37 TaxID=2921756 RepID=UPI002027B8B2|nr:heavy metal translocating P-type ATPase [Caballeronia sp. AZ1_KS37]